MESTLSFRDFVRAMEAAVGPSASALGAMPSSGASFFPTPTEISVSFRWVRDHPVVAAATCAAATAVSVVAYLALQSKSTTILDPLDAHDYFDNDLVACKAAKRGESNASDYPTEKDSTLSLCSVSGTGEVATSPHTLEVLDAVPEQGLAYPTDDCGDSESPAWGWYVSLTPPEEMYAPTAYKAE